MFSVILFKIRPSLSSRLPLHPANSFISSPFFATVCDMRPIGFLHTFEIGAEHKLHIYAGSITEITANTVVSSDDNCLSAAGGVAAAIASAAGNGIREIYRKIVAKAKTTVGDVVRASAGALNARHLYHAITDDRRKDPCAVRTRH